MKPMNVFVYMGALCTHTYKCYDRVDRWECLCETCTQFSIYRYIFFLLFCNCDSFDSFFYTLEKRLVLENYRKNRDNRVFSCGGTTSSAAELSFERSNQPPKPFYLFFGSSQWIFSFCVRLTGMASGQKSWL